MFSHAFEFNSYCVTAVLLRKFNANLKVVDNKLGFHLHHFHHTEESSPVTCPVHMIGHAKESYFIYLFFELLIVSMHATVSHDCSVSTP